MVPGARPWNLSDDIVFVVVRMAAGSILGSELIGTDVAGAPGCGAAGFSPEHAVQRESVTAASMKRKRMDIPALYGTLHTRPGRAGTGAFETRPRLPTRRAVAHPQRRRDGERARRHRSACLRLT